MATAVQGCVFCNIIHNQRERHLKEGDNTVVIEDASPRAPHHYLILSKRHINKASDLTPADLPLLKEMDRLGRDHLREALKQKGEADTVEDLLRMGFHWSKFVTVNHLHMHLLYPTRDMKMFYRSVIFRPGRFFHTTKDIIEGLEKEKNADGRTDLEKEMEGNPIATDPSELPDKKLPAAAATLA